MQSLGARTTIRVGVRPLCGPASIRGWGRLCQLGFGQSHQVGGTAFQRTGDLEDERERGDMLAALDLPMCDRSMPAMWASVS